MTWDFHERLAYESSQRGLLNALWRTWFGPGLLKVERDLTEQRRGIDVTITAPVLFTAQEKIRARDYGDVLVEIVSNDVTGAPGWAFTCQADLLLYAIAPSRRAVLMPAADLRAVAHERLDHWRRLYGVRIAQNDGYRTINVPVPTAILEHAIDESHDLEPCPTCSAEVHWSAVRGGFWPLGCSNCRAVYPTPWTLTAKEGASA